MSRITRITAIAALAIGTALGGTSTAVADSNAHGKAVRSPGAVSGNLIQVPVYIPVNACGNSIDPFVGVLDWAFGNTCVNPGHHKRHHGGDYKR